MTNARTLSSEYERLCVSRRKLGQKNKTVIFAALAAADIDLVLVTFDGEGDSGQIENVTAFREQQSVSLPEIKVELLKAVWGKDDPKASAVHIRDAIETLCYDFLEEDHGGWENDNGAFGEFRLDVPAGGVKLEFNFRYSDFITRNLTY